MKKVLALLLAMVLVLSLAACGGNDTKESSTDKTSGIAEQSDTVKDTEQAPQENVDVPDSLVGTWYIMPNFSEGSSMSACVFVGYNKTGLPAYAAIRSTNTNHRFRREAVGSDKANGFYLKGFNKQKLYVFESPIDLLSHATLKNLESGNSREWLDSTRLSLAGVTDIALKHFVNHYPDVEEICFCLDNDAAGIEATEKYMAKYADWGFKVSSEPPTHKDYNEDLQAAVKNFNMAAAAPRR